jgi:purine-binding chemotaxis protein CheW
MKQLVVFSIAAEAYGLPITQVQEIIRYSRPRTVPGAAHAVSGVINLRSKIIPVGDLRSFVGAEVFDLDERDDERPHESRSDARKIVIVETSHGPVGFVVDDVDKVMNVEDSEIEVSSAASAPYVEGIAKVGEDLIILLAPDALFEVFGLAGADTFPLAA